jgi:N6-L-threonylcarbamoyladenine synthase
MKDGAFLTLGIETSCDETAVAVTADGRGILSNMISSQIGLHEAFGGVVPEIAARGHLEQINAVLGAAISEADVEWREIDLVGATCGPGLVGAVLIGLATGKAVAYAAGKPFVGVHHIRGHVCASYLTPQRDVAPGAAPLAPPHLALVVSGGHTDLIDVRSYTGYCLLGHTRDDAVGEAFDKVARVLGLGYPGGPKMDALAARGDPTAVDFKRVYLEEGSLDFSFSGIKTGVLNYMNSARQAGRAPDAADVAASFEASVTDVIVAKTRLALKKTGYRQLAMGGGVAANSMLRARIGMACAEEGADLYVPDPVLCTDNAAMIACAAYYGYREQGASPPDLDAEASLAL